MSPKDRYNEGDRDHSHNPGANHGSPDKKGGDGERHRDGSDSGGGKHGGHDSNKDRNDKS
ncbi:hypothetical protein E5F05_13350 [Deinococcus metallilatus]|uniref:Uncharacterized protein n=2 Tax=Deinococcus TaxID=1298 RepID=A0AAJ5F791_9DEIO|nr:hypothetical protein [Deinococcus metallilatus]MBB5294049.1 hypothetical protein [Deinococcus metallilatus]QBY08838.1 hypothetical protein E5F05_13350 [Deinococcus metallilatus]RXJ09982.1 hypothetical protein ERJ73_12180 [Deinococcus metallilatus]TLK28081.1 hypothetical protein FCS05_09200 [Deinococcus metallilatus]GMA16616.1 hypothetical protein GCM10025871_29470 [Deinococcus metallilatus]